MRDKHGLEGVTHIASFHSQLHFVGAEPDGIRKYTNCAPFAALHLLRENSIEKALDAFPDPENI